MDSFYGGRKGRDFIITPANKQENKLAFESRAALIEDLKQRWQSPIGVGDYVIVSYGLPTDSGYADSLKADGDKNYNSTLWEKIYTETDYTGTDEIVFVSSEEGARKGLGYRLVTTMTGNTPKFKDEVIVNPLPVDDPPTASIDNTIVDAPQLILNLPVAQSSAIRYQGREVKDAGTPPDVIWDDTDVYNPKLTFHLPQSQVLKQEHLKYFSQDVTTSPSVELVTTGNNSDGSKKINEPELIFKLPKGQVFREGEEGVQVRFTDAGKQPDVALDTEGSWPDGTSKINEPGLIFTLPLSQKINFLGWSSGNVLNADAAPRVEWRDTDNASQDGVQGDLNNTPTLEFFLPRSQVLQVPTEVPVGPTIAPSVRDIGSVNQPKYEFTLPKAVQFYTINDASQTSDTEFTISIPDSIYDKMEVGDYLINTATGFLYQVSEKTSTAIKYIYKSRLTIYIPDAKGKTTTAFVKDAQGEWQRNQITVEKKYLDAAQTQVQFLFTIPNQPTFEFTVTQLAPAETVGIGSQSIKNDSIIIQNLKIPRGSRIFVQDTANTSGKNGDVWINPKTGDIYNHDSAGWGIPVGNIKGAAGDALNIIKSFNYDNITEDTTDTLVTVSTLLERDLGIIAGTGTYPQPDELIKVTWTEKEETPPNNVISEISYWYFYVPGKGWDRAQITAGLGDIVVSSYSPDNEDNKTYSVGYINSLINDTVITDLDKKTYSAQKINKITSWQNLANNTLAPAQLHKGTALPAAIKEGNVYLINTSDQGNNLFVDISNTERVQISASKLSKLVTNSNGETSYVVVEPEDIVTKSNIINAAENAILAGAADNNIKAIPNANGAFYSDGLTVPKFGVLPLAAGGVGATTQAGAQENLGVYSKDQVYNKEETKKLISWGNFTDLI